VLEAIAFWLLALIAIASGYGVFSVDSMARATFLLALSFVAVGLALLILDLDYLGIVSVLMMVMEMAIMAVFMVAYMMNPGGLMPMSMLHNQRGAGAIAIVVFLLLGAGSMLVPWPQRTGRPPADPTFQLGMGIMEQKGLVMVSVGALLFATMVTVVVLAAARGRYERYGDELDRDTADDPLPGGVSR
jgi:NADH:ubiquinone oxidoreductase subunit 6 (subunit J)